MVGMEQEVVVGMNHEVVVFMEQEVVAGMNQEVVNQEKRCAYAYTSGYIYPLTTCICLKLIEFL